MSLFRLIIGDVHYKELEQIHHKITILFFIVFMILVFFILLNINLALVNHHFNFVSTKYKEEIDIDVVYLLRVLFLKLIKNRWHKGANEVTVDDAKQESVKSNYLTFSSLRTTEELKPLTSVKSEIHEEIVSSRRSISVSSIDSVANISNFNADIMDNKELALYLIQLAKNHFHVYNETQTISSKIKKAHDFNVFCTKNELIIFFTTHLFASNRSIKEMIKKFEIENKKLLHLAVIYELIEYFIRNFIINDGEKLEVLKWNLEKRCNAAYANEDVNNFEKKVKSDIKRSLKNLDEIYVSLEEYESLKVELKAIKEQCTSLYENFNEILNNFEKLKLE